MITNPKILLVNFYANGDCLYATTIARQIKTDYKDCHLTWAISSKCKDIILNNPDVDDVIVVEYIHCDDNAELELLKQKTDVAGYDNVFITHPSYIKNMALFDGSVRSNVFRAYPHAVTVPVEPVLVLTDEEKLKCKTFAEKHDLSSFKNVILFEFAPQSGQLKISKEEAISISEEIVSDKETAIILSSANKINHPDKAIIDGSSLSLRETAGITHHCTMLLGCSSGITWITTSSAAKKLPMVQMLDDKTTWFNPVSGDFKRFGLSLNELIELYDFDRAKVVDCVKMALSDFQLSRNKYHQQYGLYFNTTPKIVYELLCRLRFGMIVKHITVNVQEYGHDFSFYKQVLVGIFTAPFILIRNTFKKRVLKYF